MLLHLLEQQQQFTAGRKGQRLALGRGDVVELGAHQEGGGNDEQHESECADEDELA
jgi:hypothetical protein